MKILIIRNTPDVMEVGKGNYNLQEIGLARALNKLGYQCDVVYSGGKAYSERNIEYTTGKYFKLYYLKARSILGNGIFQGIDELAGNYDVIQSGGYDQLQSWIMAAKYRNKLLIYQGPYYSSFNEGYNRKCSVVDKLFVPRYRKLGTKFITKSRLAGEFLQSKGITEVTNIGVGFDKEQMESKKAERSDFWKHLNTEKENGNRLLLYIGRLEERRNIIFLLEAYSAFKKRYGESSKLVIIGTGTKEYKKIVDEKIKELSLFNDIIYREKMEQRYLPDIYKNCDVFLLPTKFEIFGMVLLEAMYYGLPVLTTYNGGSSILIENEIDGFILGEEVNEWADKVNQILSEPVLAKEAGMKASQKIKNCYTWDALAAEFIKSYKSKVGNEV